MLNKGHIKTKNYIKMNKIKTTANVRLMAICLVTFSLLGMGCTSLQQSTSIATDDLYTTPNNANTTIASNKKIISTENWGTPNKVQNYNSNQQNKNSNGQNYNNNQQEVSAENEEYQDYQNYQDDRYLRLKVANRNRWSSIDDFGYWNDPRFNNAFYPSYSGWNSWYTGYYGASWYNPFGSIYSMGWGGYNPYMSSFGYGMGWGYNDFGYGGFGYDGFGYGGFGYGGFGYGGFGYGGWNPYFAGGFWNPYRSYHHDWDGHYNRSGFGENRQQYIATRSMQNSAVSLGAYRNNRGYNNSNNNSNASIANTRNLANPVVNTNFGSLIKRVVTNNANVNNSNGNSSNGYDRPARYFNNNNNNSANNNQYRAANTNSAPLQSTNSSNSSGGRSGGFNSTGTSAGSARPGRGQNQ